MRHLDPTILVVVLGAAALSFAQPHMPGWVVYLLQIAIAASLPALGCMILLRSGLLSFGQGLYYFIGAYGVALVHAHLGISDAFLGILAGAAASILVAGLVGFFIARYRGIFFAMLTLAISMVVYGMAVKMDLFGRSDGLNVPRLSYLGFTPSRAWAQTSLFVFCVWVWAVFGIATHLYLRSRFGKLLTAIEDNETRVEYLGWSVRHAVHINTIVAAVLGSAGGALAAASARYADPSLAYWTTSGEFVFIVLIAGQANVLAPLFGSVFLETLRTYAAAFFPDEWQLVLGAVMLAIILFLPKGLGHLFALAGRALRPRRATAAPIEEDRT
ncbi:branched-chain amino acid ABC transporter permease [Acuticoccus mangrovi]|uniref:Branched-chain amino acid ABC transporter permease n=1 Tax=Acuticoccus mangrovi TaxID=2796142 RepID=A0A934IH23_9HYPH|nr:branched-chain amino acid ABC transporter permease [Acuticoccus mangrovi]MBJ3774856.1 branched-chain amino acid ABC transporter permease [Acuticoccus mangrovi]